MNKDTFQGHWKELRGKLKQKWGKLSEDDIAQIHGSVDELSGKLQKSYGYAKDRVEREIDQFIRDQHFDDNK